MAKIFISIIVFFAFFVNMFAQIEVHSSNQVGIGTNNPQYKLDVRGDTHVAGSFYLGDNGNNTSIIGTSSIYIPLVFKVNNVLSGFSGDYFNPNVSFGYNALPNYTQRGGNTAIGHSALFYNTTGESNTAIGSGALKFNTEGLRNTAIGYGSLQGNTTGYGNTATGGALSGNTTGIYNTAHGWNTLLMSTTGEYNTANGAYALWSSRTGSYNTAEGSYSLHDNTTGSYNTVIGYRAAYHNITGDYNTAIGYMTKVYHTNLHNATAIGNEALVNNHDQVRIGNSSVTSIGGYAGWSNISDGRTKRNIRTNVPGLTFIKSLQPVTYNLDLDAIDSFFKKEVQGVKEGEMAAPEEPKELIEIKKKSREAKQRQVQTGFVAQEVEKAAKSIGYEFSGVDVDEMGIYSLRYAEFVVPLVKAVQELSDQNDRLQEEGKRLGDQNDRLQAQVDALINRLEKLENK